MLRSVPARRVVACLVAVTAIVALPAFGQSNSPAPQKNDGWQFDATPYLWGAGLDGDVKIGDIASGGVEASFSDIWSSLHVALMGTFEGRKDRWGFLVDAMYIDLSKTTPTPNQAFGDADGSLTLQMYTGVATFRVLEGKTAVDLFAGARYVSLATDITLTSGALPGRSGSASKSWWDGLGGARVLYRPDEHWSVMGYLDLGGGGSDFTWQAVAGAGYQFNKLVSLKFGYRYLDIDYENDPVVFNMAMAGPYAGVGFHF